MDERVNSSNKRAPHSAVVFGATGLVGGELWRVLEQDGYWSSITCIGRRRPAGLGKNEKVSALAVDLFDTSQYQHLLAADTIFICLGTTLKKAGSKEAFKRIDVELPALIAKSATNAGAKRMVVISAQGIHKNSLFFYNRAKAEMEERVVTEFEGESAFVRPGLLLGERRESRLAESLASSVLTRLDGIMQRPGLQKFRAIPARTVAIAMNQISQMEQLPSIIENQELFVIGSM